MKIFFLYSSSIYSYHLLIFSASVRSILFLSFIVPIFEWNVPLISLIFLKRSLVFPILMYSSICIDHWGRLSFLSLILFGTLHSDGYSFSFLLCLSLLFFSQLFVRPPQTTILPLCIFPFSSASKVPRILPLQGVSWYTEIARSFILFHSYSSKSSKFQGKNP